MKRAAALVGLGMLAPMLQGALSPFLPAGLCPNLGLLVVIGLALSWRSVPGGMLVGASSAKTQRRPCGCMVNA